MGSAWVGDLTGFDCQFGLRIIWVKVGLRERKPGHFDAAIECVNPRFARADFNGVGLDALDKLLGHYTALFEPIDFQIIRRSAWLCLSPAAQAHVDYWSGKRDASEAMSTTLRQFATIEEAGDWLVLGEAEITALQTKAGFKELARFDDTRGAAR